MYILCKTAEEEKAVLKVLEKKGYTWGLGIPATKQPCFNKKNNDKKYYIHLWEDKTLSWGAYKTRNDSITAEEFLKEHTSKDCIVIYRNGAETIALNKTTGEKAVAKCSPDDTYDFNTGARLAFDRLVKLPVKEVKRVAKVGEYVKIVKADYPVIRNGKPDYKNGDILKIIDFFNGYKRNYPKYGNGSGQYLNDGEYVVLENYQPPKKEKPVEPQYYNGKVVCIKTHFPLLTVGKIYNVENGILTYDDGTTSCRYYGFNDFKIGFTSEFIEIVEEGDNKNVQQSNFNGAFN